MEPEGAVQLVVNSEVLKTANVEVGIFIADNDSTSLAAIQNSSKHSIVKQSDITHSKKGVGNHLHDIHKNRALDPDQELTNDAINHVKYCFSCVVYNNKGNVTAILFDLHANCGDWCTGDANKESRIRLRLNNPT